jgi:hypothetical protein
MTKTLERPHRARYGVSQKTGCPHRAGCAIVIDKRKRKFGGKSTRERRMREKNSRKKETARIEKALDKLCQRLYNGRSCKASQAFTADSRTHPQAHHS